MDLQRSESSTSRWPLKRPRLTLRPRRLFAKASMWLLVLVLVASVIFTADVLRLNEAERAASPHLYSLVQWEFSNFLDKWLHRAVSVFPWNSESDAEKAEQIEDYFALTSARVAVAQALADGTAENMGAPEREELAAQLAALDRSRERLRADVEETLEAAISAVIAAEGLSGFAGLIFPPVDFLLTTPPYALITSPRDRIERGEEALLRPDVSLSDSIAIEDELAAQPNLSALVIPIGGVATYPASVFNGRGLRWTLQIAAHEWLHHYLFFRPLGFNMFDSGDMQTLNETVADLAGREIGDRAFIALGGVIPVSGSSAIDDTGSPAIAVSAMAAEPDEKIFDFQGEMRTTRLRADELLADGKIAEAEAYMEARRLIFVANGYNIRKLNQAYFAFHGTYAESGASVSPVGGQVRDYRDLSPDLGSFIGQVASSPNYADFIAELDALRQQPVSSIADEPNTAIAGEPVSSIADGPNKEKVHNVLSSFASLTAPQWPGLTSLPTPVESGRRPPILTYES
jgi:hypothetical protein